jgi:hypothetical protein
MIRAIKGLTITKSRSSSLASKGRRPTYKISDNTRLDILAEPLDMSSIECADRHSVSPASVRNIRRTAGLVIPRYQRQPYKSAEREQAKKLLINGVSIRKTSKEAGISQGTVLAVRKEIALELPNSCECGSPLGHKGWCSNRFNDSPARQKTMAKIHTSREAREASALISVYKDLVELANKDLVEIRQELKRLQSKEKSLLAVLDSVEPVMKHEEDKKGLISAKPQ